jgi:hypothetical protein
MVSPETEAAVQKILADTRSLKRLLDDLHPAPDETSPLRAVAAAMALTGHAGVESARVRAEEKRGIAEFARHSKRLERNEAPVPGFIRDAGLSLERLANSAAERYPYGWHLRFHVPGELLQKEPERALSWSRVAWAGAQIAIVLLAAGLIALLAVEDSNTKHIASSTAGVAAVVGAWTAVVLLPALAWIGLVRWWSSRRVSIDLARQTPAAWLVAGVGGGNPASEQAAVVPGATTPGAANAKQSGGQNADGNGDTSSSGSVVSREPVLLGSLITSGGTLALGLSGALGTTALAGVSAGVAALTGLLVRELVTPSKSKPAQSK